MGSGCSQHAQDCGATATPTQGARTTGASRCLRPDREGTRSARHRVLPQTITSRRPVRGPEPIYRDESTQHAAVMRRSGNIHSGARLRLEPWTGRRDDGPDAADGGGAEPPHELANECRRRLVAELAPEFPGRQAHALSAALAIMFATSMTSDPAQQSDQARILNGIISRWQPALPWQLVRRSN